MRTAAVNVEDRRLFTEAYARAVFLGLTDHEFKLQTGINQTLLYKLKRAKTKYLFKRHREAFRKYLRDTETDYLKFLVVDRFLAATSFNDWTDDKIAAKINCAPSSISKWRNRVHAPSDENVVAMKELLASVVPLGPPHRANSIPAPADYVESVQAPTIASPPPVEKTADEPEPVKMEEDKISTKYIYTFGISRLTNNGEKTPGETLEMSYDKELLENEANLVLDAIQATYASAIGFQDHEVFTAVIGIKKVVTESLFRAHVPGMSSG